MSFKSFRPWPLIVAVSLSFAATATSQTPTLVLRGATLIDATDGPPLPDATVVIKNGWIAAVGSRAEVTIPRGARVVDLAGRYLLPGFVEMHGHLAIAVWQVDTTGGKRVLRYPYDDEASIEVIRSQLAFGITTVRNPAGPTKESVALRNRVRFGELIGPRIITAGAPLDNQTANEMMDAVTNEVETRAELRSQPNIGAHLEARSGAERKRVAANIERDIVRLGLDRKRELCSENASKLHATTPPRHGTAPIGTVQRPLVTP